MSTSPQSSVEAKPQEPLNFKTSDVATHSKPLGEGRYVKTAGCLIIGDEVLNGKTKDSNSNYFAKFCFDLGIELKRIEVIADDEEEIVEAARRMVEKYDLVVTSGGIGPTHDDITYPSLARAFSLPLKLHQPTIDLMQSTFRHRGVYSTQTPEQIKARQRMAEFPDWTTGEAEVLVVAKDKWVPVVRLKGKLCIFPGIPSLFEQLLTGLTPYIPLPPSSEKPQRVLIHTNMPESSIAPYLTELSERVKKEGIRVGSYPQLFKGVSVSLIGLNRELIAALAKEVEEKLDGKILEADAQ